MCAKKVLNCFFPSHLPIANKVFSTTMRRNPEYDYVKQLRDRWKYQKRHNLQPHEELIALKKLREEYEDQLKIVGFELCDLPDDVAMLLDNCVEFQMATQLHDLSPNYIQEYFFTKQKDAIESLHLINKLKSEIQEQQRMIVKENEECRKLEKFLTEVNERLVSEAEMQRSQILLESKIQSLQNRQRDLQEDINIDALIKKIDLLKAKNIKTKE